MSRRAPPLHAAIAKRALDVLASFGAKHARAILRVGERRYDALLSEDLVKAMPRVERLRVRMLATVHPHPAAFDGHLAVTLRPIAVAVICGTIAP